ncbi:hypothetical protein O3M35_006361 [Rhynocoris fuscipes]|uniref:Solute carrier family 25 member 42 n=1 Tax=Rhynocoris fuscipes TaxID=488301 RepID=A0AAW1DKL8_9HEMI
MISEKTNLDSQLSNTKIVATSLIAGAVAGALAKSAIAPLDRTKINFQVANKKYSTKAAFRFVLETYRKDGFLALWRGNSATMARIIPYAAIQFSSHEQWKRILSVDSGTVTKHKEKRRFLAGSLAGITSQTLTYPLDLARARMAVTQKETYHSLQEVFIRIWRDEGPAAFYRGYVATILGVIPYAGVSFYTYGTLQNWIKKEFGSTNAFSNLLCGAVAGMLGQTSSYPLDIVRRRMQTSAVTGHTYDTIIGTLVKVYREEGFIQGVYKGLSMNWVKGPIAVGISFATYDHIKHYLRLLLL